MSSSQTQTERRSFQIRGTNPATVVGVTNTQVVAFTSQPALKWGAVYGISSSIRTAAAAAAAPGVWVSCLNDATFGTVFKFWRRGVYQFNVFAPLLEGATGGAIIALDLDSAATSLLAATVIDANTVNRFNALGMLDFSGIDGVADATFCLKLSGVVCITDAMAGAEGPTAAAGAQGTGCIRLLCSDGAGGAVGVLSNTRLTLWCNYLGDLAGS